MILGLVLAELAPSDAQVREDDIFVKSGLLSGWFEADIDVDLAELQINIRTQQDLPFQERQKRLENAERFMKTYEFEAVNIREAELAPYQMYSLPALYLTDNVSYGKVHETGNETFSNALTLQGNFDLARFEVDSTFSFLSDRDRDFDVTSSTMTFQRRDPKRDLLGPFNAGKIAFGDVSYPSVPLFAGGGRGAGFTMSSNPQLGFRYAGDPNTFIIDGDAPVGWDAELYRNGDFVGFQRIPQNGRFNFENVDLISGFNFFEVVLYGPEGQRLTTTREVFRGAYMLKAGEHEYDFTVGLPNSDFLPFAENARNEADPGASGQLFYGFSDFLTMGVSAYTGTEDDNSPRDTGATISASASFLGMNVNAQLMAANQGRKAYGVNASIQPSGYRLALSHNRYFGFDVEDEELESETEFSLYKGYRTFNMSWSAKHTSFLDDEAEFELENSISTNFFGLRFTNDLSRVFSKDEGQEEFLGELQALADIADFRIRSAITYDLMYNASEHLREANISAQRYFDDRTNLRLGLTHNFANNLDTYDVLYSRDFQRFGIDLGANVNSDKDYTFTVGLRAALQADENYRYHLEDPKTGGLASIGGRAFVDLNGNDIFDPDQEKLIEGIKLGSSYNAVKDSVDEKGVAWVRGLGESPTRISIDPESIQSIYVAPKYTHRDIIPRRGVNFILDFPFSKLGEIEGSVTYNGKGVARVPVQLVLLQKDGTEKIMETIATEYDGYYLFSAIKAGAYRVYFAPAPFDVETPARDKDAFYKVADLSVLAEDDEVRTINATLDKPFYEKLQKALATTSATDGAAAHGLKRKTSPSDGGTASARDLGFDPENLEKMDLEDVMRAIKPNEAGDNP